MFTGALAVQEAALLVGQHGSRGGPVSKAEIDDALGWLLERIVGEPLES